MEQKLYINRRFIESFDSVRFTLGPNLQIPKDFDERLLHARIEVMLSILMGEPLILPEPYSFDSWGFLNIANELLPAWKTYGSSWSIISSPVGFPFNIGYWGHNSYREMLADYFGRNKDKYILSGWAEITDRQDVRDGIA